MRKQIARVRVPLRWALVGAFAGAFAGAVIEATHDLTPGGLAFASLVDIWPPVLAILGFGAGLVGFAGLRRIRS